MDAERRASFNNAVAGAIARARVQAGMTQEDVAEAIDIGPEAVSRIERGIVEPTLVRVWELAGLFGCSIGELVVPPSDLEADQARVLTRVLDGLSTSDRNYVVAAAAHAADYLRTRL